MKFLAPVLAGCLACLSCSRGTDEFAVPLQRSLAPGAYQQPAFVSMSDVSASFAIVSGIDDQPQGPGWRWTREKAVLRLFVPNREGWRAVLDFSVAGVTFEKTGPVTITVSVNGHVLETVRYAEPGEKHIEKPVPPEWLQPNAENTLSVETDPPFITEPDKVKLGVVLSAAGFKSND